MIGVQQHAEATLADPLRLDRRQDHAKWADCVSISSSPVPKRSCRNPRGTAAAVLLQDPFAQIGRNHAPFSGKQLQTVVGRRVVAG